MMVFQVNVVSLAKIAKAVGLMARDNVAAFPRRCKASGSGSAKFETLVFVRDEPVVPKLTLCATNIPPRHMNCMKLSATSANTGAPCTMSRLNPCQPGGCWQVSSVGG